MWIFFYLIQFFLLINNSQCWFLDHFFHSKDLSTEWLDYKKTFKKFYKNDNEMEFRKRIFQDNLDFVNRLNENYAKGLSTFKTEVNEFADLTKSEFLQQKTGLIVGSTDKNAKKPPKFRYKRESLPKNFDWRKKGKISPVQNQGKCGSCYAFATVANCESFRAINSGYMPKYSVQELIDCSAEDNRRIVINTNNCDGCNGGSLSCGFEYVKRHGLSDNNVSTKHGSSKLKQSAKDTLFSSYRGETGTCERSRNSALINDYAIYYDEASVEDIQEWLIAFGPISIGLNASPFSFQFYKSGIYNDQCGKKLNHAVLLVGYGSENGNDYWIIKNSWGATWGENGFMRIARGRNMCGMEVYGAFAFD